MVDNEDRAIASEEIKLDPKDAAQYRCRGLQYYIKGDYDRAIADYSVAIRLDPEESIVYLLRANAYIRKDETAFSAAC